MSCSTNNKTDSSAVDSNHTKIEENSLTLLIAGDLSPSVSQIIQCSDKSLKHGFATVIHPFDTIQKQDIIWEPNFEVDGIEYPIKERVLNHKERETIAYLLSELKTKSYFEPSSVCHDAYYYILYINNRKITEICEFSINDQEVPDLYREALLFLLSMGKPLYPNFGVMMFD